MSSVVDLQPEELRRFSVPLTLRLIGERQYLLGAGSFVIATDMRLSAEVEETPDPFALSFVGRPDAAELAAGWQTALGAEALGDESALEGLALTVDFGDLFNVCPAEALLTSPALAAALTAAALAHRAEGASMTDGELAGRAASVLCAVTSGGRQGADRFYADALTSIAGGTGYIEPGGERINVQQLLPVESFTLALVPQAKADGAAVGDGTGSCARRWPSCAAPAWTPWTPQTPAWPRSSGSATCWTSGRRPCSTGWCACGR